MSGFGVYLAQSLTINCVQRALPTLLIFIDSKGEFERVTNYNFEIFVCCDWSRILRRVYFQKDLLCDDC